MPKLLEAWQKGILNPHEDVLVIWLLLLGAVDRRRNIVHEDIYNKLGEIAVKDKNLDIAMNYWEHLSRTQEEFLAYESRMKRILDEESAIREAELRLKRAEKKAIDKGVKEGLKQGLDQGLEQGIEQGIEQGLQKGKEIGKQLERLQNAKMLLHKGLRLEQVQELLELSDEQIKSIQEH